MTYDQYLDETFEDMEMNTLDELEKAIILHFETDAKSAQQFAIRTIREMRQPQVGFCP